MLSVDPGRLRDCAGFLSSLRINMESEHVCFKATLAFCVFPWLLSSEDVKVLKGSLHSPVLFIVIGYLFLFISPFLFIFSYYFVSLCLFMHNLLEMNVTIYNLTFNKN